MKIALIYDFIESDYSTGKYILSRLDFINKILPKLNVKIESVEPHNFNTASFFNKLQKYDIIISFELSDNTKKILESNKIKYLDIWLSPIRFYKDFIYSFYSNVPEINSKLKKYKIKNNLIQKRAKEIKQHTEYFIKDKTKIDKNSAIIVAQLKKDKSVKKEGYYLTLIDFYEEIQEIAKTYKTVYLLKHPFMEEFEFSEIFSKLNAISNLYYLKNENIYNLLSNKNISSVFAISSSVLEEAKYFNKKVHYFYKKVINSAYIPIYNSYFTSNFWNNILNLKNCYDFTYITNDNYMREKYGNYYAYDIFLNPKEKIKDYHYLINFYKKLDGLDKSKQHILYGYGSVGKLISPHIPNLVAIIDKKIKKEQKNIDNSLFINVEDIHNYPDAKIIISPYIYEQEIKKELCKYTSNIEVIL